MVQIANAEHLRKASGLTWWSFCPRQYRPGQIEHESRPRRVGPPKTAVGQLLEHQFQPSPAGKAWRSILSAGLCLTQQISPDVPGQMLVHFGVPGHGLSFTGERIPIDVVAGAGAQQAAAVLFQFAQQLPPFYTAISLTA